MTIFFKLFYGSCLFCLLVSCRNGEQVVHLNQKVSPIFLTNDKFKSLIQDSIPDYKKTSFSTFGAQFDDYSNRMAVKPINVRAANFVDEFSRFQIVQYDDDFNSIFSDSTDKVFINTFKNKYLHTINYSNYVSYDDELVINVSELFYQIMFLNDDQLKIERTHQQQADLVIADRMPNIELQNSKGQQLNLYDLTTKGNTYIYHMAYDCKPCLTSISEINQYKKENPDVNIVGLVTRDKKQQHLDKLNNLTENWKVFGISFAGNKSRKSLFKDLPEVNFIDSQGYFLATNIWFSKKFE
jgi:thiol-disulfide isomerase/thioredoxin